LNDSSGILIIDNNYKASMRYDVKLELLHKMEEKRADYILTWFTNLLKLKYIIVLYEHTMYCANDA